MPNHVSHKIEISPKCTNLAEALEAVTTLGQNEKEETNFFDFNKLIPEPEELSIICHPHAVVSLAYYLTERGTQTLSHVDLWRYDPSDFSKADYNQTMDSLREVMAQYDKYGRITENPDPKYHYYFALPETLDALYQSGKAVVSLRTKYKFKNWHDTHCTIWGTKWNSYSTARHDTGVVFDTAWSSPKPVINEFARKFNLTMTVKAFDEGHNFWLIHQYENGVITEVRDSLEEDKAELYFDIYGYALDDGEDEMIVIP